MKKLVKVMLSAAMAFSMVAFSTGSISAAEDEEVITAGISPDYKPYEYLTKKNKMKGFDVDMAAWMEDYMTEQEGHTVTIEFKQMDFDNIITQIQGDQVDVGISGFTYSKKRKVEWSDPYLGTAQVAVVPTGSDITSLDDLKGKSLVAQTGATGEQAAKKVAKKDDSTQVTGLKNVQDIMNALSANQYDAAIVDSGVAANYVANGDFTLIDGTLMDEKNYIIAKEGNTEIIERFNDAIAAFLASEKYTELCEKYDMTPLDTTTEEAE